MERRLATVQLITTLTPIEGADRIETATVLGWEVVVKKNEFKIGDKVVYIEVDSIVPDIPYFEFMRERKFRVRTIKLRKQVSQGLIIALKDLGVLSVLPVGYDITEQLKIKKYDPEGEAEAKLDAQRQLTQINKIKKFMYRYKWYRNLFLGKKQTKSSFPSFISKTDEERIQNIPKVLQTISEKNILVDITEKIDGQSATYFMLKILDKKWYQFKPTVNYKFGVCSRNLHLPIPTGGSYYAMAEKYKIKQSLKKLFDYVPQQNKLIVLQGENAGPGIQDNKYKLTEGEFFAFNLKIDDVLLCYSDMHDYLNIVSKSIKCVPLLYSDYKLPETVHEVVELSRGISTLYNVQREGIVVRNNENSISFKAINPSFLLKFQEA